MTVKEAVTLAEQLISQQSELRKWTVKLNSKKTSYGACNYRTKEIELSSRMIPYMTDEAIKEIIIHEIAHALTPGHNHGFYWKYMCVKLGGSPDRTKSVKEYFKDKDSISEYLEKESKYTLTCPSCGNKAYLNRYPKYDFSCKRCSNGIYSDKYKMVITQNY